MDRSFDLDDEARRLADRIGSLIDGKYLVLRLLGHGSTGAVYLCRHVGLDRLVALKVLHREMEHKASFVERFKLEAQAASKLEHPNSVRVLDFGQDASGLLYISMDYVEGRDLLQVLEEDGPFGAERAIDVMAQVLDVLSVAHGIGIIHRDLKPENILLRTVETGGVVREVVTVCDFGLAQLGALRKSSGSIDLSGTHVGHDGMQEAVVAGTPAYMSPEQARAEPQDARSDLYSAGVVLYQLMTLQLPFVDDDAYSLARKHCVEVPPPPSQFGAVSPALEAICLKALAKARRDRFQTAREMREALLRARVGRAEARPVGMGPARWGGARKRLPFADPLASPNSGLALGSGMQGSHTPLVATPVTVDHVGAPKRQMLLVGAALAAAALAVMFMIINDSLLPRNARVAGRERETRASRQAHVIEPQAPQGRVPAPVAAPEPPVSAVVPQQAQEPLPEPAVGTTGPVGPAARPARVEKAQQQARAARSPAETKAKTRADGTREGLAHPLPPPVDKPLAERPNEDLSFTDDSVQTRSVAVVLGPKGTSDVEAATVAPPARAAARDASASVAVPVSAQPSAASEPVSAARPHATQPPIIANAHVTINGIVSRSVSKNSVRNALNMDAINDCYRSALRAGTAPSEPTTGQIQLTASMSGSIATATLDAPALPAGLRQCIEQVVRRGRMREADTGEAQANIKLAFAPR